ncbi:transmembrane protein [Legionella beliardensis]|uniref:Transmembrane protein n=1 Tax=Legionella beliardensis TaxID=91822 RepID=A0A378I5W5_9GAMM|nr:hypothetical protein [Legionella beliardensis]STX30125.1 transmembrane protein [Legionella beliardensis]
MTTDTSTDYSVHNESNLYSIAGRLDVQSQSRLLAKQLHEAGNIYILYGLLDGLNLSYSTLKYCFDVLLTNSKASASDALHEWTLTPEGMLVAATESITLIAFSMLANYFKDSDKNLFKRYIAILWPYLRDSIKAVKNSYKGVRNTIQVANLLGGGGINLNFLMLPVGLALSGLTVLNRIWYRHVVNLRKDMMKANGTLLASIEQQDALTEEECRQIRYKINCQIEEIRIKHRLAFLSAAAGGLLDSFYSYMGILCLCSFSWPLLLAMTVICITFAVISILTRIYEEYDNQRKLEVTQAKIDLTLFVKEHTLSLQADFARLQELSELIAAGNKNSDYLEEQERLASEIQNKLEAFRAKRDHLKSLNTFSPLAACLEGMKNGLAAYTAASSILFAISTLAFFTSFAFPPIVIISLISLGLVFLAGFVAHSMYKHYQHSVSEDIVADKPYEQLQDMLRDLKQMQQKSANELPEDEPGIKKRDFKEEAKTIINDGSQVASAPEFTFQSWFETIRSFFSGLAKGPKTVDYTLNPLQELGSDGHYHETPVMIGLSFAASALYAFTMALRAHARSFGRPPITQSKATDKNKAEVDPISTVSKATGSINDPNQHLKPPERTTVKKSGKKKMCLSEESKIAIASTTLIDSNQPPHLKKKPNHKEKANPTNVDKATVTSNTKNSNKSTQPVDAPAYGLSPLRLANHIIYGSSETTKSGKSSRLPKKPLDPEGNKQIFGEHNIQNTEDEFLIKTPSPSTLGRSRFSLFGQKDFLPRSPTPVVASITATTPEVVY